MAKDIVGNKKETTALPAVITDDKLETLQKYKKMLDDNLISQEDYDLIKKQILA